ncbi:MAG: HNH endonuclease [Candidatus Paceibacterota bacterium]|jgi:hypothetical protein|nr:HNH endonuclease [Candidatus Omnitrophota bacterium]
MPRKINHIRKFPNHKTSYRLVSVYIDGIRRQRFEHRLIMEKYLGRPLLRTEIVHHKDENGLNNSIDNLEITNQSYHMSYIHDGERRKWSLEKAVKLRKMGYSFEKIGKIFNVTGGSIQRVFKRKGLGTNNPRWGNPKWNVKLCIDLFEKQIPMNRIARRCNVSPPTIRQYLIKNGYKN